MQWPEIEVRELSSLYLKVGTWMLCGTLIPHRIVLDAQWSN